jgi:hypothetical protein
MYQRSRGRGAAVGTGGRRGWGSRRHRILESLACITHLRGGVVATRSAITVATVDAAPPTAVAARTLTVAPPLKNRLGDQRGGE